MLIFSFTEILLIAYNLELGRQVPYFHEIYILVGRDIP